VGDFKVAIGAAKSKAQKSKLLHEACLQASKKGCMEARKDALGF
jgi:hypothetical protein